MVDFTGLGESQAAFLLPQWVRGSPRESNGLDNAGLRAIRATPACTGPGHRDVQTVDVDESQVRAIVQELRDADIVMAVPEDECLIHQPSGNRFDSDTALVHFHWGWEAATEE